MAKLDWKSSNLFKILQRQVRNYNPLYNLVDCCIAGQAAPSSPAANDVYYFTGSATSTVFGVAGVTAGAFLVYSTVWSALVLPVAIKLEKDMDANSKAINNLPVAILPSQPVRNLEFGQEKTKVSKQKLSASFVDWPTYFNGVSDYLKLANSIVLTADGDYFEFYVKPQDIDDSTKYCFAGNNDTTGIGVYGGEFPEVTVRASDTTWIFLSSYTGYLSKTGFTKVKILFDNGVIKLYYNDVLISQSTFQKSVILNVFGHNYPSNGFWKGYLKSVKWSVGGVIESFASILFANYSEISGITYEKPVDGFLTDSQVAKMLQIDTLAAADGLINASLATIATIYSGVNYYSQYNKVAGKLSETTITGTAPVLAAVGDYVEIYCRVNDLSIVGGSNYLNTLNLITPLGAGTRFGYYGDQIWVRNLPGSIYLKWTALTTTSSNFNKIRLIVVSGGWELFVNDISQGVLAKTENLTITGIAKAADVDISDQRYDIKYVNVHTSVQDLLIQPLSLYTGSSNVVLIDGGTPTAVSGTTNPLCFVRYSYDEKAFYIYERDKEQQNVYYGFKVMLNNSIGHSYEEIEYSYHWEIVPSSKYTYNSTNKSMTVVSDLIVSGESECVFMYTDPSGSAKADHTGGIHGDERIDIAGDSFVKFYINGIALTPTELLSSFDLTPCNEFSYLQRSSLHDTAITVLNKDTGLAASGVGVLTIGALNHFFIDAVDTGIIAYDQNTLLVSTVGKTLSKSGTNTWLISSVIQIIPGHPIIGTHVKKTVFKNQGYITENSLIMNTNRAFTYWYPGICCISKDSASVGHNEEYADATFTGGGLNFLLSVKNKIFEAFNVTKKQSVFVTSQIVKSGAYLTDDSCTLFIWDRVSDSKYYRQTPGFSPIANDKITSKMEVVFNCI